MNPACLDTLVHGRPGLIVHVGAGAELSGALARSARAAILFEPRPDRAAQLRASTASTASVRLIEAAVARETGRTSLHHGAHTRVSGQDGASGAQGLARELAAAFEADVDCIAAADILAEADFEGGGEAVLVIDAVKDALVVLDGLDAAGWLERFDHIIVRVSEAAREPEAPACADVEAWARAHSRLMLALPGQSNPDLWRAWISPVRRTAAAGSPREAAPEQPGRAEELEAALETYRSAAREAETRWLEQRSALLQELQASQERCARLEAGARPDSGAPGGELDAERREAAEAEARDRALREELRTELEAARNRSLELGRALQHAEAARAKAEEELQSARQAADAETAPRHEAHRDEAARFQAELERVYETLRAAAERERALTAQINTAREDLRLAITGQRLAQASLAELQTRYGALLDDRNELDGLLRQLTDRLTSAANARLDVDRQGAQTGWDN